MPYYISPPPQSPLSRIITAIIGVFILAGAFMIGMAALLVVAGVAVVAGIALWLRVAWIKRQMRKSGVDFGENIDISRQSSKKSSQVIDAEYTVISERRKPEDE